MLKTFFAQETKVEAEAQWEIVADALREKQPKPGRLMDSSREGKSFVWSGAWSVAAMNTFSDAANLQLRALRRQSAVVSRSIARAQRRFGPNWVSRSTVLPFLCHHLTLRLTISRPSWSNAGSTGLFCLRLGRDCRAVSASRRSSARASALPRPAAP